MICMGFSCHICSESVPGQIVLVSLLVTISLRAQWRRRLLKVFEGSRAPQNVTASLCEQRTRSSNRRKLSTLVCGLRRQLP